MKDTKRPTDYPAILQRGESVVPTAPHRMIRISSCNECPYCFAEPPRRNNFLCAHPTMTRKFDVTTFVARKGFPTRCKLEVIK